MTFEIETFDEALDYIAEEIGSSFEKAIQLANMILEDPDQYTGAQAAIAAVKLAAHRTNIGLVRQYWKKRAAETKKPQDRLINDALHALWEGLLELINTLKHVARYEREVINQ